MVKSADRSCFLLCAILSLSTLCSCSDRRPSAVVPLYGRFERSADNRELGITGAHDPYDPGDIKVDVRIEFPDGSAHLHPCFWHVPCVPRYDGALTNEHGRVIQYETFMETGPGQWCFRFSPAGEGLYSYRYLVTRKNRVRRGLRGSFLCSGTNASYKAPVIVDEGARYFRRLDGTPFVPIGQNFGWPEQDGTRIYSQWLRLLGEAGGNCGRLWLIHYMGGTALEWSTNSANAGYRGVGAYSQESGARVDRILESAESNGICLMLCFFSFGDLNWDWEKNPYCVSAGGWLRQPAEFFTDTRARECVRNRLRYAVARYGWSRSVWAWELWNEVDISSGYSGAAVLEWHREMASYLKETDVHRHPVTTSYRFAEPLVDCAAYRLAETDFVNLHVYYPFPTAGFPAAMESLRKHGKPVVISEYGLDSAPDYFDADPAGLHLHDGIWAGIFCGSAGSAMTWWWERYVHPRNLYFHYTGIARFLDGVDLRRYTPAECDLSVGSAEYFVFGLKSDDRALVWIGRQRRIQTGPEQDGNCIRRYDSPAQGGPLEMRIRGKFQGVYRVEHFDTFDGVAVSGGTVTGRNGDLVARVPEFRRDIAVKCTLSNESTPDIVFDPKVPIRDHFEKLELERSTINR